MLFRQFIIVKENSQMYWLGNPRFEPVFVNCSLIFILIQLYLSDLFEVTESWGLDFFDRTPAEEYIFDSLKSRTEKTRRNDRNIIVVEIDRNFWF
jgi:hypothetical protein